MQQRMAAFTDRLLQTLPSTHAEWLSLAHQAAELRVDILSHYGKALLKLCEDDAGRATAFAVIKILATAAGIEISSEILTATLTDSAIEISGLLSSMSRDLQEARFGAL